MPTDQLSATFAALADPTRRAMLDLLLESERTAGELAGPFRMSQPAISQHLRVLREAGLVRGRPAGRQRRYRLNLKPILEVYGWAAKYKEFADPFGHAWRLAKGGGQLTWRSREPNRITGE